MTELLQMATEDFATQALPVLIYCLVALLLAGAIFYYFYAKTETSQAIKILKKYQHTEFQELEVLDSSAAGSRVFMLLGTKNKKRVTINRFGKISEINE